LKPLASVNGQAALFCTLRLLDNGDCCAIADAVAADGGGFNLRQMYVTRTPKSARTVNDVLQAAGLGADQIVAGAMSLLQLTAS